jgi:hypothetical protein
MATESKALRRVMFDLSQLPLFGTTWRWRWFASLRGLFFGFKCHQESPPFRPLTSLMWALWRCDGGGDSSVRARAVFIALSLLYRDVDGQYHHSLRSWDDTLMVRSNVNIQNYSIPECKNWPSGENRRMHAR